MRKARGLLWEFVGGKVRPGETKEQTLIRECHEELAIAISVDRVFIKVDREYPDLEVHLTLFSAAICEGVPQMLEHNDIRWITPGEISQYEFCPADEMILKEVERGIMMDPGLSSTGYELFAGSNSRSMSSSAI